jgi:hypothetical protein
VHVQCTALHWCWCALHGSRGVCRVNDVHGHCRVCVPTWPVNRCTQLGMLCHTSASSTRNPAQLS